MNGLFINNRKPGVIAGIIMLTLIVSCTSKMSDSDKGISIRQIPQEKKVDVYFDGDLFTAYIYPDNLAKPVLYPIISASGKVLTRGFPPKPGERVDHPHHVGHWLNYGDVNGLDFWNNSGRIPDDRKARYGYIEHSEVVKVKSGRKTGSLEVKALWKNYDNKVLLTENTTFEFSSEGNTRIIDRITTLKADNEDVLFKDNKEGMIAIRVARALELPTKSPVLLANEQGNPSDERVVNNDGVTGNYLSSEGITGGAVWATRARWMILSGIIESENVALAMIDHPDNVGYPTYWHARDYGLFSANTLGQEALSNGKDVLNFKLPAGESVTFKYRILVQSGDLLTGEIVTKFADSFSKKK